MIQRPSYLSRIHEEYHNRDTVLFLVGARQVGKSTLIAMAKEQGIINASRTRSTS
jgi:predicted AAA+ superfamily ATPase